jgi:hypothetical protein
VVLGVYSLRVGVINLRSASWVDWCSRAGGPAASWSSSWGGGASGAVSYGRSAARDGDLGGHLDSGRTPGASRVCWRGLG